MSVPSGIIHFETGDALPGVVVGYVSIRSQGGVSFLDADDLTDLPKFFATDEDRAAARKTLEELEFHIVAESRLGMAIAGPPQAWAALTDGELVAYEQRTRARGGRIEDVTHIDIVGPGQPDAPGAGKAKPDEIEGVVIERPRAPQGPIPPPNSRFHLRLPDDVAMILKAPAAHRAGYTGRGVTVAMVDSGYGAHPFFEAHAYAVRPPVTVVPGTTPAGDPIGHGTGEAANVFAIAPDAELWPVRASNQQGDMVAAVAGFMRAKMDGPDVLSNSWGGDYPDPLPPEPHAADRALVLEILDAIDQGIIVVFAAGNGSCGVEAQVPGVIAAGGVYANADLDLQASTYASGYHSDWFGGVDVPTVSGLVGMRPRASYIAMPVPRGCRIDLERAFAGGDDPPDGTTPYDGWALFSGTSAACPQVAGAAAVLRGMWRQATPKQVCDALCAGATDVYVGHNHPRFNHPAQRGRDLATGHGLINVSAALEALADTASQQQKETAVPDDLLGVAISQGHALTLADKLANDQGFRDHLEADPVKALASINVDASGWTPPEKLKLAPATEFEGLYASMQDNRKQFRTLIAYLSD
ncbi:S8 family serine peptidase [Solirubrobacter ginsenosidimutans]|uniref:S8 family serine peptidase n=1 Tax=Solirubrobacter ginsenosidimutans TaxID=490573 RepID=A0A9X3MQ24_9ACTN|nr:S8 family serine peptidase [Solirubrobacter ginsenosidimutans]MDA0160210.1 S8 family serine peptidase [Solirubrobacter ginsenosidimutans]